MVDANVWSSSMKNSHSDPRSNESCTSQSRLTPLSEPILNLTWVFTGILPSIPVSDSVNAVYLAAESAIIPTLPEISQSPIRI